MAAPTSVTKPLPATLGEALDALEEDDVMMAAPGSELMELFHSAKAIEWEAPAAGNPLGARHLLPALLLGCGSPAHPVRHRGFRIPPATPPTAMALP